MKSKKGTVLLWLAVFGLIAALGIFLAMTAVEKEPGVYKGKQQLELLGVYNDAEKILFYVDQCAKYAVPNALEEISEKGGFFEISPCGMYLGYQVWNEECMPDYEENVKSAIDKRLNPYFAEKVYDITIPKDNYDYLILDNGIAGIAKEDLHFYTPFPGRIEYYVKPSFTVRVEHGIGEYNTLTFQVLALIERCKDSENLGKCVEENKPDGWNLNYCDMFSSEERECLEQEGKVSWFEDNEFADCRNCPSDAECNNYIGERYCNLDPCGLRCTWDGVYCKEKEEVEHLFEDDVFKFCKVVSGREYKFAVEFS